MALTDVAIRGAILKDKRYKLADAEGMYLDIHPNGQKYWRLKYRFMGKEKLLALGVYPETTLAEAREKRNAARKMLANGIDPMEDRKETKRLASINAENTFEAIANEWIEAKSPAWTPRYTEFMKKRLAKDILPQLGQRPIKEISAPELLSVIRVIEKRGATELAHRALQYCGQIDDNSNNHMRSALQIIKTFAEKYECLALVITHPPKSRGARKGMTKGAFDLEGMADIVWHIDKKAKTQNSVMTVTKGRDGHHERESFEYRLVINEQNEAVLMPAIKEKEKAKTLNASYHDTKTSLGLSKGQGEI